MLEDKLYNYRVRKGYVSTNVKLDDVKLEDMYQEMYNVKNFYKERGLYEDYKRALLKMMNNRIQTSKNICKQYNTSVLSSIEILKDFDYPGEYTSFNEKSSPLFSIIVPIYNVEKYLEQCLMSIKFQTEHSFEVLCLDDCSSDNSYAIAEKFTKEDSRIRLFRHKKNRGIGVSRNTAIKLARGKYIICVDSDDWIKNDCLQNIADSFAKNDVDSVWFKSKTYNEETQEITNLIGDSYCADDGEGYIDIDETNIMKFNYFSFNKAYKRECILANQAVWTEDLFFEDVEFYFRYFTKSTKVYMLDKILYYKRSRANSVLDKLTKDYSVAKNLYDILPVIQKYLKKQRIYTKYKESFFRLVYDYINIMRKYIYY